MDHFINIFSSTAPEKAMVPHSSIFAWKIPWTEEPGRLQSMGSVSPELGRTSGTQLTGEGKTKWTGLCSVGDL